MIPEAYTVKEVIEAWTTDLNKKLEAQPEAYLMALQRSHATLQLLSRGKPISPELLASYTGNSIAETRQFFREFQRLGGELDEDGNLIGNALTLNPTPHKFRINGKQLYTWCSLDAVFLPGLLGKTAEVESACPVTGELIRLTIAPGGVETYSPRTTVLSITIPGISCKTDGPQSQTGPQSDTYSQMHFFSAREAAESWRESRLGVAIFTVEEAYQLAYANWISRKEKLLEQHKQQIIDKEIYDSSTDSPIQLTSDTQDCDCCSS